MDGVEIQMRYGRTLTVSGRVLDASGAPASGAYVEFAQFMRNGSSSMSVSVGADGSFRIVNVHPGDYAIRALTRAPYRPEPAGVEAAAFLPITVADDDLEDLVVSMKKTIDVPGRIRLDDPALPFARPNGSGARISARLVGDPSRGQGSAGNPVFARDDHSFLLPGMFGVRVLDVENVPRGWYVKSIRYGGREVIDERWSSRRAASLSRSRSS